VPKSALKTVLEDAVKKRIPLKEPQWGLFLSGGLDSSIVAAIASKHADNITYYTLTDTESIDYKYVMELAQYLGIENKIKVIPLPTMDTLGDLIYSVVYHTESYNPSIVSNGLATYLIAQAVAADGLRVALSGEGADELFSGYRLSKSAVECFSKRAELIENMHFTELRRLDLASMAHTLEVRCPFLDKAVLGASESCTLTDLLETTAEMLQGKQILRPLFKNDLPLSIVERKKVSFDVGSGIRQQVVQYLSGFADNERQALKKIWTRFFGAHLSEHEYCHAYPTFDKMIDKRGQTHA
jgi:asparagine synthase (glutamine-hydrolysing)